MLVIAMPYHSFESAAENCGIFPPWLTEKRRVQARVETASPLLLQDFHSGLNQGLCTQDPSMRRIISLDDEIRTVFLSCLLCTAARCEMTLSGLERIVS